ncbi:hypothetical protein BDV93DRAFT_458143, partial [Ceratobasidium sp. AG-I]
LDNASPNLTLVQHLQKRTPHFLGLRSYVRCFVHIINLMAKAFLSPFSRPSRSAKRVLEENMATLEKNASTGATKDFLETQQAPDSVDDEELEDPDVVEVDQAEIAHDVLVVQDMVFNAINQMVALYGVAPTKHQLRDAQAIMPAVAGLARRVEDSPTLKVKLQDFISMSEELKNSKRKALSRRVATRWNSDRKALDDHIQLRQPVQWLTSESGLKLQRFALKNEQWPLAVELNEALEIFEVPTNYFSRGGVPLVYEVLPAIMRMKTALEKVRHSSDISAVTRVGAQAALNVFDKYMANMSICEVYFIAIVMRPDIKLNWLRKYYDHDSVQKIRDMISARFKITYGSPGQSKLPTESHNQKVCTWFLINT